MSWYKEAVCMRCGRPLDGKFYDACPKCAEESVNVNYRTIYDLSSAKLPAAETTQPGIYRFRDFYPLEDSSLTSFSIMTPRSAMEGVTKTLAP